MATQRKLIPPHPPQIKDLTGMKVELLTIFSQAKHYFDFGSWLSKKAPALSGEIKTSLEEFGYNLSEINSLINKINEILSAYYDCASWDGINFISIDLDYWCAPSSEDMSQTIEKYNKILAAFRTLRGFFVLAYNSMLKDELKNIVTPGTAHRDAGFRQFLSSEGWKKAVASSNQRGEFRLSFSDFTPKPPLSTKEVDPPSPWLMWAGVGMPLIAGGLWLFKKKKKE